MKKIGTLINIEAKVEKYKGFSSPNFTPTPDDLFDRFLSELNGGELKVILYIIRRTFGFKKNSDSISLNQLASGIETKSGKRIDKGTGLSLSAIKTAVKSLEKKGLIKVNRVKEEGGYNVVNVYSLRFQNREEG